MTKPTTPLDQFIKEHLAMPCGQMVDRLNADERKHLISIGSYLEYQREYPVQQIITLKIKLFEYYSCMRQFENCHFLQADIFNLLVDCKSKNLNGFESQEVQAQYYLLQGIQFRNFKPVADFAMSEDYFQRSEAVFTVLQSANNNAKTQQKYINEHFRVLMNRLGLYVNYDNQPDKAAELIERMEKSIEVTTVNNHGYLSIYRYCVGSYYLNKNDYENAIKQFNLALVESNAAPEALYSATDYRTQLNNKLMQATNAFLKQDSTSVTTVGFYQPGEANAAGKLGTGMNLDLNS